MDAWPGGPLGATFLTSFTFNGPFFEAAILPALAHRHASPIVVFVDRSMGYAPTVSAVGALRAAGRDYYLVPVDWGRHAFHPKVHLFCAADVALVGSGNLSPGGMGRNLEAFDRLDGSVDASAVAEVKRFFRALLSHQDVALPAAERQRLLGKLVVDERTGGDATFIHTLQSQSLHDRVQELDLGGKGRETLLAAPFQDYNHATSQRLKKDLQLSNCRIAADPRHAPPTPKGFTTGALVDEHERPLHAKLVYWRGPESALLCLGSANLSTAAWEGRNVEAVVVRQSLDPSEFDPFINAVQFEAGSWGPTAQIEDRTPQSRPQAPQASATLHGDQLTIEVAAGELELSFSFDDGESERALEGVRVDETTWTAKIDGGFRGCGYVLVTAPGHRPSVALVLRAQELRGAVWQSRVRRARMGEDAADDPLRLELLAQIGELLGRLHSRGLAATPKVHLHSGAPDSSTEAEPEASGEFSFVDELEEGLRTGPGNLRTRMRELGRIIELALTMVEDTPEESPNSKAWSPSMLDDVSVDLSEDDRARPDDADQLSDKAGNEVGLSASVVADVRRLAERMHKSLSDENPRPFADDIVIYDNILRILECAALNSPGSRTELNADLIKWLEFGWAVESWPDTKCGWIITAARNGAVTEELDIAMTMATLFTWLHWVDPEVDSSVDTHRGLDRAQSVFAGLREVAGGDFERDVGGPERPVPTLERFAVTFGRVSEHVPLHVLARRVLEPVWQIERAGRKLRRLEKLQASLQSDLDGASAAMTKTGHRSTNYKQAAERKQAAETQLEKCVTKIARARVNMIEIRTRAAATDDVELAELIRRWDKKRWTQRDGQIMKMARPERGACGCCQMMFHKGFAAQLRNPMFVADCSECGVLVATGPQEQK